MKTVTVAAIFFLVVSFFQTRADSFSQEDCAASLQNHVKSKGEFLLSWEDISALLANRISATLLVGVPLSGLSLSIDELSDLEVPRDIRIHVLKKFSSIVDGGYYFIISGESPELSRAHQFIQARFNHGTLVFQMIGSELSPRVFTMPTPTRLFEVGDSQSAADEIERQIKDKAQERVALFDSHNSSMVFLVPEEELGGIPGPVADELEIKLISLSDDARPFAWWRENAGVFESKQIVHWNKHYLISPSALSALKALEGREVPGAGPLSSVDVAKEFLSSVASELGKCHQDICVHFVPSPPQEKKSNGGKDMLLAPFFALMRSARPDLAWSYHGHTQDYFETLIQNVASAEGYAGAVEELKRIEFRMSDTQAARNPGAAQERVLDAIHVLARILDVDSGAAATREEWLQQVIQAYHRAVEARKKSLEVAKDHAKSKDPQKHSLIAISDFSLNRRYSELKFSRNKPLALVTYHDTPGWAVFSGLYFFKTDPGQLIDFIETESHSQLSETVKQQIVSLKKNSESSLADLTLPSTRLGPSKGMQRMHGWQQSQKVGLFAPSEDMGLPFNKRRLIVVLPLQSPGPGKDVEVEGVDGKTSEKVVELEPVESEASVDIDQPLHEQGILDSPQKLTLLMSPKLGGVLPVSDTEDVYEFLRSYHRFSRPIRDREDEYSIIYSQVGVANSSYQVNFKRLYSAASQQNDIVEITSMIKIRNADSEKQFWRDLSTDLGVRKTRHSFKKEIYVGLEGTRKDVYISGSVLVKSIVKHRLTEDQVHGILDEVRSIARSPDGDYVAHPQWQGAEYEAYFTIHEGEFRLKTLYRAKNLRK